MILSDSDRAVLAHVVVDPDAWLAHAVSVRGEDQATKDVAGKVARWRPDYEAALARDGEAYQTRAERDAEQGP